MFAGHIFSHRVVAAHRTGLANMFEDIFHKHKNIFNSTRNNVLNSYRDIKHARPQFLGVVVFGILVYKGDLFDRLETPLFKSLNMYEDNPAGSEAEKTKKEAFKQIWNTVQQDVMP